MFQDLTLQQFCALDYERNMVVTSGPGAGKTRILSHRYCFILLTDDSVTIPQILTLTFTEKAAEEMKNRIYEMISRLERRPEIGSDHGIAKKIRTAKEQFHQNRISTIHAFCASLLREHPVEAGMDPGFGIIHGARQKELMDESIEAGLSDLWKRDKEMVMPMLRLFGGRRNLIRALHNIIEHPLTFRKAWSTAEQLFRTEDWTNQVFTDYCRFIKEYLLVPYLKGLEARDTPEDRSGELFDLLKDWERNAKKDPDTLGIPELFRGLRDMAQNRKSFSPRFQVTEGLKKLSYVDMVEEHFPDIFYQQSPDARFEKELRLFMEIAGICTEQYRSEKNKINALDFADLESRSYSFLHNLYEGGDPVQLNRIQNRFRYIMVDEFQDTNAVQWNIIRLLCSRTGPGEKGLLAPGKLFIVGDKRQSIYRFRGGDVTVFERVTNMVKDSNPSKPALMFWEKEDITTRFSGIFRDYDDIRSTQAEAFHNLSDSEKDKIRRGDVYLPHNFRTDFRPVDFINRVFKEIFGNKGAGKPESYETVPREIRVPDIKRRSPEGEGSVTVYLNPPSSERSEQQEKEAALIAGIIEEILGRRGKETYGYRTYPDIRRLIEQNRTAIGILFFTFRHIKVFESIFREAGIPFTVHRGKGFYRCEEIMEILHILHFLTDETQRISLLAALRSPVFGLEDAEIFDLFYGGSMTLDRMIHSENAYIRAVGRQMDSWRFLTDRLTITELIRKIIHDRSLTAIHSIHPNGAQRLANIEKLIEIARLFQMEEKGSLPEFVEYCLEMADEEEEEGEAPILSGETSPISLMTVHAAKGLEFSMVIIPDLDHRLPVRPETGRPVRLYSSNGAKQGDWNYQEGELPLWQVEIPALGHMKKFGPLGNLLMRRDRLEDMAENRRVFYVACTRARNHLVLIATLKKRLLHQEREPLTPEDYRERATVLDILDDMCRFYEQYPPEEKKEYTGEGDAPAFIWSEPELREFKGFYYEKGRFDRKDLGLYDHRIKEVDLSGPIESPRYLHLSFQSVRIYKKCPVRFYLSTVLGCRIDRTDMKTYDYEGLSSERMPEKENDEFEYDAEGALRAEGALILGTVVHAYLEKHPFGSPVDEELLDGIWKKREPAFMHAYGAFMHAYGPDRNNYHTLRQKAATQIERTVSDAKLMEILGSSERFSEVPFLFKAGPGIEFRGVIDSLSKDRRDGCWTIIDWKTSELMEREPEDVAAENDYFLQLECYRWAVEQILHERVGKTWIYFTDKGRLLEGHARGTPEHLIKDILQKIRDYDEKRDLLQRDAEEMRREMKECIFCEFRGNLCRG